MNYLCEENIDSDDDNFDFRIYNDVAVDLEGIYSCNSNILAPGRRRKIRKLSSSDESADDGEPQEENLTKSICNVKSSDWQENFTEDIVPRQFEFSTGTKTPGPQMLPYEWGMQKTPYSPRPDIVADTVRRKINRELTVLSNDISTIDNTRMKEVDDLFKGVQIHRSQYKDRTGSFHPLTFFKPDTYMYQCAPGMTTSYFLKYPTNYVKHKMPIVSPLTYERRMQTPYIPDLSLSGIYNKSTCIAYKR